MKTKITVVLALGLLLAAKCGNLFAQEAPTIGSTAPLNALPTTTVNNTNQDVLVVTGRIIDAESRQPIKNTKINFDRFGEELLHASIDDNGNYSIVLNKKELGEPIRVIFKIAGYKKFVVKGVRKTASHVNADLFLEPEETANKSNGTVKFFDDNTPGNTTVIKLQ
jgi:hypothetical protein